MKPTDPTNYVITQVNGEFVLNAGAEVLQRGPDPRRLSDWAFQHHAVSVRHDYRCDVFERRIASGEFK